MSSAEAKEIVVQYHPDSLEGFCNGGNTLKIIGTGRIRSPGHPAGNQQYHSQGFIRLASVQRLFPAYFCHGSLKIYMGEYQLHSFAKKESFEGFTYFLYTLIRRKLPQPSGESPLSSPVLPDLQGGECLDKKA
jgi:hypothetical protein